VFCESITILSFHHALQLWHSALRHVRIEARQCKYSFLLCTATCCVAGYGGPTNSHDEQIAKLKQEIEEMIDSLVVAFVEKQSAEIIFHIEHRLDIKFAELNLLEGMC
jgi:hypothetical protein